MRGAPFNQLPILDVPTQAPNAKARQQRAPRIALLGREARRTVGGTEVEDDRRSRGKAAAKGRRVAVGEIGGEVRAEVRCGA